MDVVLPTKQDSKMALIVTVVITTAWAISFIVDIVVETYDPPASVHALMMIVAGSIFGSGLIRKGNGD